MTSALPWSTTPGQFVYTRTMGPKEIVTGTNSIVDAKLWGLTDDTEILWAARL